MEFEGSYDRVALFARTWREGQSERVNPASKRTVSTKNENGYATLPLREDITASLRQMAPHAEALESTAALKHLADVTKQWSDAQYLRTQYQRRGGFEGMVDAAIRRFRGEP